MPRKDNEKLAWLIVGGFFTAGLIAMDIWYSSFSLMPKLLLGVVAFLHLVLVAVWILIMVKFSDPNYDGYRKPLLWLCVGIMLIVGIHHATAKEDAQIIIDSKENAAKP